MQNYEDLQEIYAFGEENAEEAEMVLAEAEKIHTILPLMQIACCALILLGLLLLKHFEPEKYREIVSWYQVTINQKIELPALRENAGGGEAAESKNTESASLLVDVSSSESEGTADLQSI